MTNAFEPVTLHGDYCTLVPLTIEHHDDLCRAVRDGELWKLWYTLVPTPEKMKETITSRLAIQATGSMLTFSVINNQTTKPVGMTTYLYL